MAPLELRADIFENPLRTDFAPIQAAMLFPDDDQKRSQCEEACAVAAAIEVFGAEQIQSPLLLRGACELTEEAAHERSLRLASPRP
jgi:hypothetical protein